MKSGSAWIIILSVASGWTQITLQSIRNASANTWIEVPNTHMDAVDPCPARNCAYSAVEGVSAVMNDWCGGAYDSKRDRLVVWGGGHNGYYGNELYAFDVPTLKWVRLTDPSTQLNLCQEVQGDGLPCSRHTYGGLTYIADGDLYFGKGGAWACPGGNGGCLKTWTFDFSTLKWKDMKPAADPSTYWGDAAAYDPKSKKVWFQVGSSSSYSVWGIHSYNPSTNQWVKYNSDASVNGALAVDTSRKLLFMVGSSVLKVYDISSGSAVALNWTTTGDLGLITSKSSGLGLDYDPVADRIVGWHGGAVYALNPATKVWTSYNPAGAPSQNAQGTYGRWHYSPLVNAFVSANHTNQNVYFYKMTAGAGTGREAKAEVKAEEEIRVSPNPFRGRALLSLGNLGGAKAPKLTLFDAKGAAVRAYLRPTAQGRWELSARGAAPGIYFLKADFSGRSRFQKVAVVE